MGRMPGREFRLQALSSKIKLVVETPQIWSTHFRSDIHANNGTIRVPRKAGMTWDSVCPRLAHYISPNLNT